MHPYILLYFSQHEQQDLWDQEARTGLWFLSALIKTLHMTVGFSGIQVNSRLQSLELIQ